MTDIKEIKINVPVPKVRKSRKAALPKVPVPTPKGVLAPTPKISGGTVPISALPKSGDPLPALSTIKIGGQKKPAITVKLPYSNSAKTPSPPVKPVVKTIEKPVKVIQKVVTRRAPVPVKVTVQPIKRKNFTIRRKFTAKRIVIQVENTNKVKNNRSVVEKKVADMPLSEITDKLRTKGLVRMSSNPPELMQRNMMIDIMLFPTPL